MHKALLISMNRSGKESRDHRPGLPKTSTGIQGLDEITGGSLPAGRPTLICGSAGTGKTMLAGATEFGEPGVFYAI
jgi:circadian clock protein KaiC